MSKNLLKKIRLEESDRRGREITLTELHHATGISVSVLSRFESQERQPKLDHLAKIAAYYSRPFRDLVEPDHPSVSSASPIENAGAIAIDITKKLPVIGKVAAGMWLEVDETRQLNDSLFNLDVPQMASSPEKASYGLIVAGTSINKIARDGDVLVCVPIGATGEIRDGDLVIVERKRAQGALLEVTAKRFKRMKDHVELWPESTDPRYQEPILISEDDLDDDGDSISILAKVSWVYRPVDPIFSPLSQSQDG